MKGFVCFVVLVLCALALAQGNNRLWEEPAAKCKWNAKAVTVGYNKYYTTYMWVFGAYMKSETYNYHGDLVKSEMYRPDLLEDQKFVFDGYRCSLEDANGNNQKMGYEEITGLSQKNFAHIEPTTYGGQDCWGYYNDDTHGKADKDGEIYYVSKNGFIIAHITDNSDWELRTVTNFTYGVGVQMKDFTFSKATSFRCHDERAYRIPDAYFAQCAASTVRVVLSVVLATVFVALSLVF